MKAYVLINIRTGDVKKVVKELRKLDNVVEANMTFGPYDSVALLETEDINGVGSTIVNEIQSIPGVLDTLTCLAVDV